MGYQKLGLGCVSTIVTKTRLYLRVKFSAEDGRLVSRVLVILEVYSFSLSAFVTAFVRV